MIGSKSRKFEIINIVNIKKFQTNKPSLCKSKKKIDIALGNGGWVAVYPGRFLNQHSSPVREVSKA